VLPRLLVGRYDLLHRDLTAAPLVDEVEQTEYLVWNGVYERLIGGVRERKLPQARTAGELEAQPPLLVTQTIWRRQMTQLVPVEVAICSKPAALEGSERSGRQEVERSPAGELAERGWFLYMHPKSKLSPRDLQVLEIIANSKNLEFLGVGLDFLLAAQPVPSASSTRSMITGSSG
jgi:hypothetical protein